MNALPKWFNRHRWAAFLVHQITIFLLAFFFLSSVRRLSGRSIHLGRDPIGLLDGTALVLLSLTVIFLTSLFYHWIRGADAPPLGLAPTLRRVAELIIGLIFGFAFAFTPWALALWRGTAWVSDRIDNHFAGVSLVGVITTGFLLLLVQGIMEETANRAFPIRLWDNLSLALRIVVPSIFFAAIHLADEQFSVERVMILLLAGMIQGLAYALTGNIWFASGLHTAANVASFSMSGLWHAGAIVALRGQPWIPNWVMLTIVLAMFTTILFLRGPRELDQPSAC